MMVADSQELVIQVRERPGSALALSSGGDRATLLCLGILKHVDVITNIRTDLDGFSETEARILENHGYTLTNHYLKRFTSEEPWKELADTEAFARSKVPFPDEMGEEQMRHALRCSSKRSILFFTTKRSL